MNSRKTMGVSATWVPYKMLYVIIAKIKSWYSVINTKYGFFIGNNHRSLRLFLGCTLMLTRIHPAFACDLCAVFRSMEAKSANQGFYTSVFEQFTHFGSLQLNGAAENDPVGQVLDSSITQFIAGYQANDRFGVQVDIPYIHRSYQRPEGPELEKGTVAGIGDVNLIGHYRVIQQTTANMVFAADLIGGVKFPTGNSDRLLEERGEVEGVPGAPESGIHGHDLALGSGSYDGVAGTAIFASWKRLFLTGGIQYTIRGRGDIGYRYANDVSWYLRPGGYLWLSHKGTFGLQLDLSGETKGKDDLAGVRAEDTGLTALYIGPEFTFTWKDNLSAELGSEFPVVMNNTALQLVPDYRIKAALTWRF